jgi:Skp family chaperone for outer membrane proteins
MKKPVMVTIPVLMVAMAIFGSSPQKEALQEKPTKKNPVVVFVDLKRLLSESKLFRQLDARIKAVVNAADATFSSKYEEFSQKKQAFLDEEAKMTPTDRDRRDKELRILETEIADHQKQVKELYQSKEADADRVFQSALDEVIAQLSKELGWDVVLNRSFPSVIWNSAPLDQTDIILKRLNDAPFPSRGAEVGPLPPAQDLKLPMDHSAPPPSGSAPPGSAGEPSAVPDKPAPDSKGK